MSSDSEGFDMTTLELPANVKQVAMPFFPAFTLSDVDGLSKAMRRHFLPAGTGRQPRLCCDGY